MTLLEDLWYGNISPVERPLDKSSASYQLHLRVLELEDRLTETFSPDQNARFLTYEAAESENASAREAEAFCIGFRLATQLLLNAMQPFIET